MGAGTGPAAGSGEGERRRVFVGDVQGCARELDRLLEQLEFAPERHELWFAGDLVNRGPDSLGALRRVREIGARTVLGNHDLHLLGCASGERSPRAGDTLDAVLSAPDRDELLDWLRGQPLVHAWDDLLLVHAGVHPDWGDELRAVAAPLEREIRAGRVPWEDAALQFLTRVRYCNARGELPAKRALELAPGFEPWDVFYRGRRLVVCGHWSQRGLVRGPRLRSLDTGCVWGGALSAWIAEQDRVLRIPAARAYCTPG